MLPVARKELGTWKHQAALIPDPVLREQALASIAHKRFHADGGSVYAAVNPRFTSHLVRLIVALQTISDYLDNLCDRCMSYDQEDFHQLHHAMRDAVQPDASPRAYYEKRGCPDDGGYLTNLVVTCQSVVRQLPGYSAVLPHVAWLVERYCELQEIKHIEPVLRRPKLEQWWLQFEAQFPDVAWWEFAAATGSTLGMFSLFLMATEPCTEAEAQHLFDGYFPYLCGLHILLDYLIDLEEDLTEGDFNFVRCYPSAHEAHERLRLFARESFLRAKHLRKGERIHRDVVKGLLGMYLSDEKVGRQKDVRKARKLLWEFGPTAWMYYGACQLYRVVR